MEQRKTGPAPTADEAFSDRPQEDIIAGRNAVAEALRAGRAIDSVLLAKGDRAGSISALAAQCRRKGVLVKEVDSRKLDALCGPNHQGIAALAACKETVTLDELFAAAEAKGEPPFFVVCDELEDPHNLGAILRRCGGICPGGPGVQHHRCLAGDEKAGRLGVRLGYGRRNLVFRRHEGRSGGGGRLRGPGHQPAGEGTV